MNSPRSAQAANELDPSRALEVHVGVAAAPAPLVGLSTRRDHVAQEALPEQPQVLWHRNLQARLASAPAVDGRGRVVLGLDTGRVVQLDPSGRIEWNVSVGGSAVLAGPVLTQNDDRWVLTRALEIWRLRSDGAELSRVTLPAEAWRTGVSPLPLENGDVVFALGRSLFRFDPRGELVATSQAPAEIVELVASARRLYAVLKDGRVHGWTRDARLVALGTFPAPIARGPLIKADERLVASLDNGQIVELDLAAPRNERVHLLATESLIAGPVLSRGKPLGLLESGALWQADAVDAPATPTELPASTPGTASGSAAILGDREGRIFVARAGTGLVALDSAGSPTILSEASCGAPLALVPAGRQRALLACSSGALWLVKASGPSRGGPNRGKKDLVLGVAKTQVRTSQ